MDKSPEVNRPITAKELLMPSLLHTLLPLSSTPKPPANSPAYDGPFAFHSTRPKSLHTVAAVSKTTSETRINNKAEDDYHATLKALNSKGRFPRKSLGQVICWF